MTVEFSMRWPFRQGQRVVVSWLACALAPASFMVAGCLEPPCRTAEIPDVGSSAGDEVFRGTTAGKDDLFQPSCGSAGTPDGVFAWRAPSGGRYRFDTLGSQFDTVLSLWTGDVCDGQEMACNDDDEYGLTSASRIDVQLEAGETVYVAVEGYSGAAGSFVVNVQELVERQCSDQWDDDDDGQVDCADPDCGCECPNGTLPATLDEPFAGSTTGGKDFGSSWWCGGSGAPDTSLAWTPPRTGRYRIDITESTFDTLLYIQQGNECGGAELACGYDPMGLWLPMELTLEKDIPVIITVDGIGGSAGDYILDIVQVTEADCDDFFDDDEDGAIDCDDEDCDCTCPSEDLGSSLGPGVYTGSTADRGGHRAGSCGGYSAPDASFVWTAPAAGTFRIDTEGSTFDTVLYVQEDGTCNATELACNDQALSGNTSELAVALAAGESVVITVDGYLEESGDFVLNIAEVMEVQESSCVDGFDNDGDAAVDCDDDECDCTCPMDDLGSALGGPVFEGSTTRRGNLDVSACGGDFAPDASFVWIAPQTADYRIHTIGSSFDTVLYVQEGDVCGGTELACNDDAVDLQSVVELGLTAGQPVIITVDGFGGAGDFALTIECPTCT
jgi:uncharacterized protein (DUF779 family)